MGALGRAVGKGRGARGGGGWGAGRGMGWVAAFARTTGGGFRREGRLFVGVAEGRGMGACVFARGGMGCRTRVCGGWERLTLRWRRGYTLFVSFPLRVALA